jgi:hypothetical protein
MFYYVMKTGLPMFDACRAYGLALILEKLRQAVDANEDVTIQDAGAMYLLNGPSADDLADASTVRLFDDLITLNDGWSRVLLTISRRTQVNRLAGTRTQVEDKIGAVRQILENPLNVLAVFKTATVCDLVSGKRKGYETVFGSMDVSAFKGFREPKLDTYTEGGELSAPKEHWAIALLGGANLIYWSFAGDDYAGLLPSPQFVMLYNHREVKRIVESGFVNRVSMATVAAHYAVRLADALRQRRASKLATSDRYSDLIIQTLSSVGKGQAWKAQSGSLFPMEFPMSLVNSNETTAAEILKLWDTLFRYGNKKGKEAVAITLADLIAQPSLENAELHFRVHLRASLKKDEPELRGILYQTHWLQEVMQHVQ